MLIVPSTIQATKAREKRLVVSPLAESARTVTGQRFMARL